jgi:hypothetical protein
MDSSQAIGLWKSSFGPVKIEYDNSAGPDQLMGVWVYDRNQQEIIGFFSGPVEGNVLRFDWKEPSEEGDPLEGSGYLVFDASGRSFTGRWWTTNRDRGGPWSGWRAPGDEPAGGQTYGGAVAPAPAPGPAEPAPPPGPAEPAPVEPPPVGEPAPVPAPDPDVPPPTPR